MKRILTYNQLFEYRTGEKHNTKWSDFENMMALYYYKTDGDLSKLGVIDNEYFVNKYIGTNEDSIKMQSKCFQYLQTGEGLKNYSKSQENVNKLFGKYSEAELREWILDIINSITDDEIKNNIIKADYKNKELLRRREEKKKEQENRTKRKYTKRKNTNVEKTNTENKKQISNNKNTNVDEIELFNLKNRRKKLSDVTIDDTFIRVGDILDHKKFGRGEVMKKDNSILDIDFFENNIGIKKILFNPEHYNWKKDI